MEQALKKAEAPNRSKILLIVKWLLIILAVILIIYFGTLPVRGKLGKRYLSLGDSLLLQKRYLSADLAYKKAELLLKQNAEARSRRQLAERASQNILELENFLARDSGQFKLFKMASEVPANETEAVKLARRLIEQDQFQLAVIPAKTAIMMDKNYRDAWLYAGIALLGSAQTLEAKNEVRDYYKEQAREAFRKAYELDPTYAPAQDWQNRLKV